MVHTRHPTPPSRPARTIPAAVEATPEAKRPNSIVIFRKPSERNTSVLSKVLKAKEVRGPAVLPGVALLAARSETEPHPRVFERLGVAAADLTAAEVSELRDHDVVARIVPNSLRHIPPILEDGPPQPARALVPALPSAWNAPGLSALGAGVLAADPRVAYLMGIRDAADLALRILAAGAALPALPGLPAPPALLPPQVAAGAHSWCLALLGIGPDYTVASGEGVKVAVLDTGIDLEHPDFAGRFPDGKNTASFIAGHTAQDGNGHGTHCAGVIAGPVESAGGTRYGVAPRAQLLVGKVLNDLGSGYDDQIIEGIQWAAEAGARIISMSLGSPRGKGEPYSDPYEVIAENLLDEEPGVLIVAAAGNESNRPSAVAPVGNPAACPSILAVAAVDQHRQIAWFSCGQMDDVGKVALSAPGVQVYSSWTGNGFKTISGTSMATPHAAGVAALYLSRPGPGTGAPAAAVRARDLANLLRTRATPLGEPRDFGSGLVQAP